MHNSLLKKLFWLIRYLFLVEVIGFSILVLFMYSSFQFHKDIKFGRGTFYMEEKINDGGLLYYILRNNYESPVILYQVQYYYDSRQEQKVYVIGSRTEVFKESYVIIDYKENTYKIYDDLLSVKEGQTIFRNRQNFKKL